MAGDGLYVAEETTLQQYAGRMDLGLQGINAHIGAVEGIKTEFAAALQSPGAGKTAQTRIEEDLVAGRRLARSLSALIDQTRNTAVTGTSADEQGHQDISRVEFNGSKVDAPRVDVRF